MLIVFLLLTYKNMVQGKSDHEKNNFNYVFKFYIYSSM